MPASRVTRDHLSASDLMNAVNSSGVLPTGSAPSAVKRSFASGSASTRATSDCRRATVSRGTYEADLGRGINRFRWVEYSFSASLMLVLICAYSGITDIAAILTMIGANVAMMLCTD